MPAYHNKTHGPFHANPVFTGAFINSTINTKRGDELTRNPRTHNLIRLPNHCGLLLNFQWGGEVGGRGEGGLLRSGANYLPTVVFDEIYTTTCPVRAVEQFVAVGNSLEWYMASGDLFPAYNTGIGQKGQKGHANYCRGKTVQSAPQMSLNLKQYR